MDHYETAEAFAAMWRQSRADAGKSQDYLAKKLGVSKKTIQNWECGLSSPSQMKGFEWFQALGLQPLPYYLRVLYPEQFGAICADDSDDQIEAALILYIKKQPPSVQRKMLYMLYGSHGSAPEGVLEMITAYLHTPLRDRINVASTIINNYELAEASGQLINPNNIGPDMEVLAMSFTNSKAAVKEGKNAYTNVITH